MTRVRAKYGRRLKQTDYEALAECATLREALDCLRTRTHFAPYFEKLANDPDLSKTKIENILKKAVLSEAGSLCSFEKSVGKYILKYMTLSREAEMILDFIINLSLGTPEKMILQEIPRFNSGTKLNFNKLFQLRTAEEIGRYLTSTKYSKLVSVLPKKENQPYDISLIESVLDRIKSDAVLADIEKAYTAETARILSADTLMRDELKDLRMIYRAKKYYGLGENHIRTNLIGHRYLLTQQVIEEMLGAKTAEEAIKIFSDSRYASRVRRCGTDDIELFCKKALAGDCIKHIHFSTDPAVVLSSYMRLLQTECDNITTIIEGISYRCAKEEILSNLVIITEQEVE